MSPIPGRVARSEAADLDEIEEMLSHVEDETTLIFDVDNTLVPQGAQIGDFRAAVNAAIDRFEAHPRVGRVLVLTNGRQRGVPRLVSRANKPWTTRRRLALPRGGAVWVVGDQVLTDGILAWRLQARFIQLVIDDHLEPEDQARIRRRGRWLEPILFREGQKR